MQNKNGCIIYILLRQLMQFILMPFVLFLISHFAFCQEGNAQESKSLNSSVQIDNIVVSKFPEIYAVVSAKSELGQTIKDLNPDNFFVTTKENIQSFNHPKTVLPIVKAKLEEPILYITTFINGHKSIEHFKNDICNGIKDTLSQAGFVIDIGVVSQDTLQPPQSTASFTHDSSKICQSVQTLGLSKESIYYEKLQKSVEETRNSAGYKCGAVALITTHDDDNFRENAHELERCIRTAREKDVPVYVLWINTLLCACEKNGMKKLTLDTGGKYFEYEKKKGLKAPLAEIVRDISEKYLRNQYAIVFDDPDIEPEKRFHTYTIGVRTHDKGEIKYATLKPIEIPEGLIRKNRADIDLIKGIQELKDGQYSIAISTFRSMLPNLKLLAGIANYQENALKLQDGVLDGLRQIFNKATDSVKEGNFETAESLLKELNKHVSEDNVTTSSSARITKEELDNLSRLLYAERGIRLKNSGKLSDAITDLLKAIEGQEASSNDPLGKAVRIGLCEIYSKNGEYNKVIQYGEGIQKIWPNEDLSQINNMVSTAYIRKAEELAKSEDYSQAKEYMKKGVALNSEKSEKDMALLGEYALLSSDYQMAVEIFESVLKEKKDGVQPQIVESISKAYMGNCQFDEARNKLAKMLQNDIGNKGIWDYLVSVLRARPLLVCGRILAHHALQYPPMSIYEYFSQLRKRQTRLSADIKSLDIIDNQGNSLIFNKGKDKKNYLEQFQDMKSNFSLADGKEKLLCRMMKTGEVSGYSENHLFVPFSSNNAASGFIVLTFDSNLDKTLLVKLKSCIDKQLPLSEIVPFLNNSLTINLHKSNGLLMAEMIGAIVKDNKPADENLSSFGKIFFDAGDVYYFIFRTSGQEKKLFIQPDEFERKEEILADKEAVHAVVFGKSENVIEDFLFIDFTIPVYTSSERRGVLQFGVKMEKGMIENEGK